MKKITRKMRDRKIAGVCSALADRIGIDPIWVRLTVLLAGLLVFPWVFVAYFIAALIIPKDESEKPDVVDYKRLYRVKKNRILGGVCTGMAQYFEIDVVAMRLIFLGLTLLGGFGVLAYIILWMITPKLQPMIAK
jgi:phage shock protein PspC (stress-responsive transcriptional regulator)